MATFWRFLRPAFPASRVQHVSDLHPNPVCMPVVGQLLAFCVQCELWSAYTRPVAVRRSCCGMLDCCCVPCIFPTCRRALDRCSLIGRACCHVRRGGRFADDRVEYTSGVQQWQFGSFSTLDRTFTYAVYRLCYSLYSGTYEGYGMLSQSFVQIRYVCSLHFYV